MITSDSDYMENLKSYYDKNTIKKILNDKKVLGIQSYDHYVNAFVKNYKGGVIEDDAIQSIQTKVNAIEDNWIESALKDIFLMFETETPAEENEGVVPPALEEGASRAAEAKKESATPVVQQELTPRPPAEAETTQEEAETTQEAEAKRKAQQTEEDAKREAQEAAAEARKKAEAEEAKRKAEEAAEAKRAEAEEEKKKKAEADFKRKPEYQFNEQIMKEFQKYEHLFTGIDFRRMTQ